MKKGKIPLITYIVLIIASITCNSCNSITTNTTNTPLTIYKTYEMKLDDIRLRFLSHPLFSLEYPKEFELANLNQAEDLVITVDCSRTDFGCHLYEEPLQTLSIEICKPKIGQYENANDKLKFLTSKTIMYTDNFSSKKVIVSGIIADYLESYQKPLPSGKQYVYRTVIFDYSNLIWEIDMISFSYYPESSRIQEYFDHIIFTFKILG